jgi:hypothetical protein
MNVYYNNFLKVSILNKSKFFSESLFNDTTLFNASSENFVLNTNNLGYSNFKKNNLFLFNFFENVTLNNMTSNLITHMDLEENSR